MLVPAPAGRDGPFASCREAVRRCVACDRRRARVSKQDESTTKDQIQKAMHHQEEPQSESCMHEGQAIHFSYTARREEKTVDIGRTSVHTTRAKNECPSTAFPPLQSTQAVITRRIIQPMNASISAEQKGSLSLLTMVESPRVCRARCNDRGVRSASIRYSVHWPDFAPRSTPRHRTASLFYPRRALVAGKVPYEVFKDHS
jgi:hypothetical protein